jgi:hypothetical protein
MRKALYLASLLALLVQGESARAALRVVLQTGLSEILLGEFNLTELPKSAKKTSSEKDPQTGDLVKWEGYLLSALVDHALEKLTVEQRASVDLVVLQGRDGKKAAIPRVIVATNPMILALKRGGKELAERGPVYSVVPWTSQSKLSKEPLPLERYFIPGVERIELTSSRSVYGMYLLTKRSDPRAVKGERLFVQACMGCHDRVSADSKKRGYPLTLSKGVQHKEVAGLPSFSASDHRALETYFKALSAEVGTPN